jgi:hypothetical protein
MRTITTHTDAYKFEELTDEAKEKAIANLYDINVDFDWWDCIYDDAKTIGCKIKEFDIDRGSYCKLVCDDAHETARLIVENHGKTCDTYKLADEYLKDYDKLGRDEDAVDKLLDELETEFKRALGEEYLSLLRREYEYLTSEDAIVETIQANEYEFTEDGKLV